MILISSLARNTDGPCPESKWSVWESARFTLDVVEGEWICLVNKAWKVAVCSCFAARSI